MSGADVDVHLSIGEVLALLQEEFPDCTISKIRFLESQGLIQPDRTASGYRKFYEADIERLRWILRQQRDHFLPLKVIRKMLDEGVDRYDPGGGDQPTLFTPNDLVPGDDDTEAEPSAGSDDAADDAPGPGGGADRSPRHPAVASAPGRSAGAARPDPGAPAAGSEPAGRQPASAASGGPDDAAPEGRSAASADAERRTHGFDAPARGGRPGTPQATAATGPAEPAGAEPARGGAGRGGTGGRSGRPLETPADVVAALQEDPRRPGADRPERADRPEPTTRRTPAPTPGEDGMEDLSTAEELCAATGVDVDLLAGLERFGLVVGHPRGGEVVYGRDAQAVCRLAARYASLGVEPRHLRMYLVAAEREAGFVEQLAVPLLKQRNPAARDQARSLARELEGMGVELHALLLRRELGPDLGG